MTFCPFCMDRPLKLIMAFFRAHDIMEWKAKGVIAMRREILQAKLEELNRALIQIGRRAEMVQGADREALHGEIRALREQCRRSDEQMRSWAESSRLKCMQDMARAEMDFCALSEQVAQLAKDPEDAEMPILCAEFAIDVAVQVAMRAQLAALIAIDHAEPVEEEEIS